MSVSLPPLMDFSSPLSGILTPPSEIASLSPPTRSPTPLYSMENAGPGWIPTYQFLQPCSYCQKNGYVCCESILPRSSKCEHCRQRKRTCSLSPEQNYRPGPKVWSHSGLGIVGVEAPESGPPTSAGSSYVSSGEF